MIIPKFISLDTSIFGEMAKDYFSKDVLKAKKAKDVVSKINESGFIPFFTFHHIQELIQYENTGIVRKRWSLIGKFHTVAWMCSYDDETVLGSVVDINKLEVISNIESEDFEIGRLRSIVRKRLVQYCSGSEFIARFESAYMGIRKLGFIDLNRNKELESLSHIQDKKINSMRLLELLNSKLRSKDELIKHLIHLEKNTVSGLQLRGDKNLANANQSARYFVQEVMKHASSLYSDSNANLYESFVHSAGVRLDQVSPNTSVGEFGYISIYNKKTQIILESLGLPSEIELKLAPQKSGVWLIWRYLDEAMKNEEKAHGSNIIDRDLSVLALVVDIFTVDRRVKEYFRQLSKKNPLLGDSFSRIDKLSTYVDLKF